MNARFSSWFFSFVCLVVCTVYLTGCSEPTGTISGKVTFKGEAVTSGSVNFVPAEGDASKATFAMIQSDGSYTATVPTGKMKIAIVTPSGDSNKSASSSGGSGSYTGSSGKGKSSTPQAKASATPQNFGMPKGVEVPDSYVRKESKYFNIPSKYKDPDSSGLSTEVKSGENKYDIPLQ
jgi:hypothetical protein